MSTVSEPNVPVPTVPAPTVPEPALPVGQPKKTPKKGRHSGASSMSRSFLKEWDGGSEASDLET